MDESAKGRYDIIWGRDILSALEIYLKFSDHVIKSYARPFRVSTATMVFLGQYSLKDLNAGKITPESSFKSSETEEMHEF